MERNLDILGKAVSSLELGGDGYSFCSGKAAFATILDLVESGAHVIASDNLNHNTYQIFESVRRRTSALTFSYVKDFKKVVGLVVTKVWTNCLRVFGLSV